MKKSILFISMLLLLTGCTSGKITSSVDGEYNVALGYKSHYQKKNEIIIGEDTIPPGIYQVTPPSNIDNARFSIDKPYEYEIENKNDKVLHTSSSQIVENIAEDSFILSGSSKDYTVYLPEGYCLSSNAFKPRDWGKRITLKKVSDFPEVKELPSGSGMSKVKEGTKDIKIELNDDKGIKSLKDSATIFTFNKTEYIKYEFDDEEYKITKYNITNDHMSPYSKVTHYYNEEVKEGNSIKVGLLDNTFIRSDVF